MKCRIGFVSNSSSSSFVVINRKTGCNWNKNKPESIILLTDEQVKSLEDFGFKKSANVNLNVYDSIGLIDYNNIPFDDNEVLETENYVYNITCNEDYVIYFLLLNKISFKAKEHYGYYTLFYDSNDDYFIRATDFGAIISMDGYKDFKKHFEKYGLKYEPIKIIQVEKYLEDNKEFYEDFDKIIGV